MALSWQVEAAAIPDPDKRAPRMTGGKLDKTYEVWRPQHERDRERADRETSKAALVLAGLVAEQESGDLGELLGALMWRPIPSAVCACCGGEVPLREDGLLINHRDRVLTRAGYDPLPCPGSRTGSEATDD